MKRIDFLKHLGVGIGAAVAIPTLIRGAGRDYDLEAEVITHDSKALFPKTPAECYRVFKVRSFKNNPVPDGPVVGFVSGTTFHKGLEWGDGNRLHFQFRGIVQGDELWIKGEAPLRNNDILMVMPGEWLATEYRHKHTLIVTGYGV